MNLENLFGGQKVSKIWIVQACRSRSECAACHVVIAQVETTKPALSMTVKIIAYDVQNRLDALASDIRTCNNPSFALAYEPAARRSKPSYTKNPIFSLQKFRTPVHDDLTGPHEHNHIRRILYNR